MSSGREYSWGEWLIPPTLAIGSQGFLFRRGMSKTGEDKKA